MQHIDPALLESYFENRCTLQEREQVEEWLCQQSGLPAADPSLLQSCNREAIRNDLWQQVAPPANTRSPIIKRLRDSRFGWLYAAACVLMIALVLFRTLFTSNMKTVAMQRTFVAPPGKISFLHLADGSTVELNAGAILLYPETFPGAGRQVTLQKGEAFFSIARDDRHPFTVQAGNAQIEVLGTRFNICQRPDHKHLAVTLAEGSIRFSSPAESRVLQPGDELLYNPVQKIITVEEKADLRKTMAWRQGILLFEETPLHEVLTTLGNYYGVTFRVKQEQNNNLLFSARFSGEPLSHILHLIELSTGLSCTANGHLITIE
jgi:ferric-dicitrate binding protein FerR (iron transport regulator)